MQPFMKNVAVEYAAKALPDGELAKEIKDLKDIPVLTEDNAVDIFKSKPKFVKYDGLNYIFYFNDDTDLYYVCVSGEECHLYWFILSNDGSIEPYEYGLAQRSEAGTRLYRHELKLSGDGTLRAIIITTLNTPFIQGVGRGSLGLWPSLTDRIEFSVMTVYFKNSSMSSFAQGLVTLMNSAGLEGIKTIDYGETGLDFSAAQYSAFVDTVTPL